MTDACPTADLPRPTTRQVLLGLFIAGQLGFLFAANVLNYLDHVRPKLKGRRFIETVLPGWTRKEGHFYDACQVASGLTSRWAEVTGQPQDWGLFAPTVVSKVPFLAVELRWDGDPPRTELLLSENEPADPHRFFRVGKFRLRRYESNIDLSLFVPDGETAAHLADEWRDDIERHVRQHWPEIHAYLRWRTTAFLHAHPDLPPPRQAVLLARLYAIPRPDAAPRPWTWQLNSVQPLARWQPGVHGDDAHAPVEWYDPLFGRFTSLEKDE
jgi:hypothetical protein